MAPKLSFLLIKSKKESRALAAAGRKTKCPSRMKQLFLFANLIVYWATLAGLGVGNYPGTLCSMQSWDGSRRSGWMLGRIIGKLAPGNVCKNLALRLLDIGFRIPIDEDSVWCSDNSLLVKFIRLCPDWLDCLRLRMSLKGSELAIDPLVGQNTICGHFFLYRKNRGH